MSTFYGGEQIVEIKTITKSGSDVYTGTLYTCPAGHVAYISPLSNTSASSYSASIKDLETNTSTQLSVAPQSTRHEVVHPKSGINSYFMFSGDILEASITSYSAYIVKFVVYVYKRP